MISRGINLITFVCAIGAAVVPGVQAGDAQEELKQIRAAWQKRQGVVRTARYVIVGERLVPKGALSNDRVIKEHGLGEFPKNDEKSDTHIAFLLDFDKPLLRKEHYGHLPSADTGEFRPFLNITVFDGKDLTEHHYNAVEGEAAKKKALTREQLLRTEPLHVFQTEAGVAAVLDFSVYPIFFAHGIIPTAQTPVRPTKLRVNASASGLVVQGKGVVSRRECIILEATDAPHSHHQFWVDRERGGAVVRATISDNGVLRHQVDVEYSRRANDWMPQRWTRTYYDPSGGVKNAERLKVQEFELNPQIESSQFKLKYRAGMLVMDARANRMYKVGKDGKTLIPYRPPTPETQKPQTRFPVWGWALALNGCIAATIAGWFFVNRYRRNGR